MTPELLAGGIWEPYFWNAVLERRDAREYRATMAEENLIGC